MLLVARSADELERIAAEIERAGAGSAHTYPCDLATSRRSTRSAAGVLADHRRSTSSSTTPAARSAARSTSPSERFHDFERTMQLNYFGAVRLILRLLPAMRERGSGPDHQHLHRRGADANAALLRLHRLEGRARGLLRRRPGRDARRRHPLHDDLDAARADADDLADLALRGLPGADARGGRPRSSPRRSSAARAGSRRRSRTSSRRSTRSARSRWTRSATAATGCSRRATGREPLLGASPAGDRRSGRHRPIVFARARPDAHERRSTQKVSQSRGIAGLRSRARTRSAAARRCRG